jgi:hypothetical protein
VSARHRRHIRKRAVRRLGFIFADDAPGLAAAVVARHGDSRAELHLRIICGGSDNFRARAALRPIAQIARYLSERGTIRISLRARIGRGDARQLGLDFGEAILGHIIQI